jgi:hypothetical protein
MKIPSIFYGRYAVVVPICRKLAKQMVQAGQLEIFDPEPFVETNETPGMILLTKAPPWRADEPHFHCGAMTRILSDLTLRRGEEGLSLLDKWVERSFEDPWRLVGILEDETIRVLSRNRALRQPLIEAAIRFWPILSAEGARFTAMTDEPRDVWSVAYSVKYALGNDLGLSVNELRAPLPAGGLEELVRSAEKRAGAST